MSIHDRWSGARSGDGKRWEVRYREAGRQRKRRFDSRAGAERFDAKRRMDPEQRQAVEGRALTVEAMMETWWGTKQGLKPKTLDAYTADRREVLTTFSGRLAGSVAGSEVRTWTARKRGVWLRRRSLTALSQGYRIAVGDGLLAANPCLDVPLPKLVKTEQRFLSWAELEALADAAGESGSLILLLGTTGLRMGEMVGLQVGDVDPRRGRIRVARSVVVTSGGPVVGTTKAGRGRTVPVPRFVLDGLPLAGRTPGEWLFLSAMGRRLDPHNWRTRVFRPAAIEAGLGRMHPHELRHTAASLAIASGADVKAVQRMLGHASAAMTLDLYGHLWDEGLDQVSERLNALWEGRRMGAPGDESAA